jgi:hypothetical protein
MTSQVEQARQAARLVAFAMRPKLAAGADADYGSLCREYRVDAGFRELVEAVAAGLDLTILAVTDYGLVITPDLGSVFEYRLADFAKRNWDAEKRTLTGLALAGIAASCYPRDEDLESDITVRRTILQIESLITEVAQRYSQGGEGLPADVDEPVWQAWSATPQTRQLQKGRYAADCRLGIIQNLCSVLEEQGFAKSTTTAGTFQFTDRFRIQIRDCAGHDLLDALREHAMAGQLAPVPVGEVTG